LPPEKIHMHLGVIGLPQSVKTTLINALTHGNQPAIHSGWRFDVRTAVVEVPDPRVDRLAEIFQPRKTTYFTDDSRLDNEAWRDCD